MGRSATVVTPLVAALFAALLASCAGVVEGAPSVAGVGEPIYGLPVSDHGRVELVVAAAARDIAPCGLLDQNLVASLGQVTAFGPVGDLSTCHAELVPPRGTPANPVWVEVTVGEREPTEDTGAGEVTSGIEVRPAVGALPARAPSTSRCRRFRECRTTTPPRGDGGTCRISTGQAERVTPPAATTAPRPAQSSDRSRAGCAPRCRCVRIFLSRSRIRAGWSRRCPDGASRRSLRVAVPTNVS